MKSINLTKNFVAHIDDEDEWVLAGRKWVASFSGRKWYVVRGKGKTREYLHRLIVGAGKGVVVDHIDGDTMNNTRSNLRICSKQQNSWNSKKRESFSGFKGVAQHKDRWTARLTINGKNLYLGLFDNKQDAAISYNEAAKRHFGAFARLNNVSDSTIP